MPVRQQYVTLYGPNGQCRQHALAPNPYLVYLGGDFVEMNGRIHNIWWHLLHPELTKDTFGMMILYYPKIVQWHIGPPYLSAGSAIWGQQL